MLVSFDESVDSDSILVNAVLDMASRNDLKIHQCNNKIAIATTAEALDEAVNAFGLDGYDSEFTD